MVRTKFIIWCRSASADSNNSLLTLIEVMEELTVLGFPIFLPETRLVALLERDVKKDNPKTECFLDILLPKTETITKKNNPIPIDFKDGETNRLVITIPPLLVQNEGLIEFIVYHKKKVIGRYSVSVTKKEALRKLT